MDFKLFFEHIQDPLFFEGKKNICFRSDEYAPLFFQTMLNHLEKQNKLPYPKTKLDLAGLDKKNLIATLNQSILGNCAFFWLGNVSDETQKSKNDNISFLLGYKGPHTIAYFLANGIKANFQAHCHIIDLPSNVDLASFEEILLFLGQSAQGKKLILVKKIFKEIKAMPMDSSCMLANYLELVNTKYVDDFEKYIGLIMGAQPTLGLLSDYFFAKNTDAFFNIWVRVEKEYPEMFWVSFWAEQIWRAYHVITHLKKNDFIGAKKLSFRLPYSFINSHWKKYSLDNLKQLYDNLYQIDFTFKKGSTFCSFDVLFTSHFLEKIKG